MSGTLQDKLAEKQSILKRKLFDYKIRLSGNCTQVIRLKVDENKYADETISIIDYNRITAIINYPTEIPLYRIRGLERPVISEPTGTYLFDILPIEVFTQFSDNVEKGDILVQKIADENNNDCLLHILRVSEVLGAFKKHLIWKKSYCAPHNMTLTNDIITIINKY